MLRSCHNYVELLSGIEHLASRGRKKGSWYLLARALSLLRKGGWYGWKPSASSQVYQFELFELILLSKLDKQLAVERFEATVSQSAVSSPPPLNTGGSPGRSTRTILVHMCIIHISISLSLYIYIYIYNIHVHIYIYIYIYIHVIRGCIDVLRVVIQPDTPNFPTNIIPTYIASLKLSEKFPMGLGIPPLKIKITLESNPLKSIMLVGRLAVVQTRVGI